MTSFTQQDKRIKGLVYSQLWALWRAARRRRSRSAGRAQAPARLSPHPGWQLAFDPGRLVMGRVRPLGRQHGPLAVKGSHDRRAVCGNVSDRR